MDLVEHVQWYTEPAAEALPFPRAPVGGVGVMEELPPRGGVPLLYRLNSVALWLAAAPPAAFLFLLTLLWHQRRGESKAGSTGSKATRQKSDVGDTRRSHTCIFAEVEERQRKAPARGRHQITDSIRGGLPPPRSCCPPGARGRHHPSRSSVGFFRERQYRLRKKTSFPGPGTHFWRLRRKSAEYGPVKTSFSPLRSGKS